MPKFHIHPLTGNAELCRAQANCPFGTMEEHSSTRDDARKMYEEKMSGEIFSNHKKSWLKEEELSLLAFEDCKDEDVNDFHHNMRMKIRKISNERDYETLKILLKRKSEVELYRGNQIMYLAMKNYSECLDLVIDSSTRMIVSTKKNTLYNWLNGPDYDDYKNSKPEIVYSGKQELLIFDNDNSLSLRDALKYADPSNVYAGRRGEIRYDRVFESIKENADNLITSFIDKNGNIILPDRDEKTDHEDFSFVGSGLESNIYLHEPTQMVYKVPHRKSINFYNMSKDADYNSVMRSILIGKQERYAAVEEDVLENNNAEYCPTHFMMAKNNKGQEVPIIVQPYLDPDIYIECESSDYDLAIDLEKKSKVINDAHTGNWRLNQITGKIVLFDCLLE